MLPYIKNRQADHVHSFQRLGWDLGGAGHAGLMSPGNHVLRKSGGKEQILGVKHSQI